MAEMLPKIAFDKHRFVKPSGVDWIGDIPSHWDVKPGFAVVLERIEKNTGLKENVVLSLSYGKVIVKPEEKMTGLVPESFETYQLVYPNDIIIRPTDLQNDKTSLRTGLSKDKGVITNAYINLIVKKEYSAAYFHYYLHVVDITKVIYTLGNGLRQSLGFEDFKRFKFLVPPSAEQGRIAQFLDRKIDQIDQAIAQKEMLIELLEERRQILIQKVVTRGLNPNVKLKDSGVKWIGQVPEHWNVVKNRALFSERNEPGNDSLPILSVSIHTAVSSEELDDEENIRGKIRIEDKSKYKLVDVGDIVFNMMRAWQGAIGSVSVKGMVSPAYIVARSEYKFDSKYFEYLYRTGKFIQQMDAVSKGITDFRKRLYWHEFKQLVTLLPPRDEQEGIVSFIGRLDEMTNHAVTSKGKEIEKLKEYRATIIESAVTGKIKV